MLVPGLGARKRLFQSTDIAADHSIKRSHKITFYNISFKELPALRDCVTYNALRKKFRINRLTPSNPILASIKGLLPETRITYENTSINLSIGERKLTVNSFDADDVERNFTIYVRIYFDKEA